MSCLMFIKHEQRCRSVTAGIQTENIRQSHTDWHSESLPVIVGFERAVLVEAHVLGLLVSQLCQVGVKDGQVQTGHILIWGKQGDIHTVWMTVPPSRINNNRCVKKEADPSSWAGDTRPACTGPLVHWIARSGPGPAEQRMAAKAQAGEQLQAEIEQQNQPEL